MQTLSLVNDVLHKDLRAQRKGEQPGVKLKFGE